MKKEQPKYKHGGRRPNQTGRPTMREGARRVHFHCTVDPETKASIADKSEATGKSAGVLVDEAFRRRAP